MSNIFKRKLNDIQDDLRYITRYARQRAEGDQRVDEPVIDGLDIIELQISEIKRQLDDWYSSYRKLHPKGALPAQRAKA